MSIKYFSNFFRKIGFVFLRNVKISKNNIKDIIDIFDSKCILMSAIALHHSSEIFKRLMEAHNVFEIVLPSQNTITAETKIIGGTDDIKLILSELIDSEPRCITLYGFDGDIENKKVLIQGSVRNLNDNKLVTDNVVDFILSIVLEEGYIQLSFNKCYYDPKFILKKVKLKYKQS